MKSVAKRLSAATLMVALLTSMVGVRTAGASTPEVSRSESIARVRDSSTGWTFYAAFATAGACWAKAAAYKNEYWWVDATTCVYNAAQKSWFMFYES